MSRREIVFAVLPTMLTLGNAVCGFGAITFAAKWSGGDAKLSLFIASGLIFLAMVFDALDGSAARLTKQTSEFGAQLDSLCDAISFGVAPGFILLQLANPGSDRFRRAHKVLIQERSKISWIAHFLQRREHPAELPRPDQASRYHRRHSPPQ